MTKKLDETIRKHFGDSVVDIIQESLVRLDISLDPGQATIESANKMLVLFHFQSIIQDAIHQGMENSTLIEILKEIVIINELIYKSSVEKVNKSRQANLN